ncbi:MAG: AbrB/MazE/SpoVT family DNA-binding domain-containing protein [bacterium]
MPEEDFWKRPRLPRGFWRRAETLEVLRKARDAELGLDEAIMRLGGPEKVNRADVKWYVARLRNQIPTEPERARIGQGGRLVIPASYRQALGLREGDEVTLRLEDGELRLTTPEQALRRAQALLRQYVPANRSLADELIAERRRDARRE